MQTPGTRVYELYGNPHFFLSFLLMCVCKCEIVCVRVYVSVRGSVASKSRQHANKALYVPLLLCHLMMFIALKTLPVY